MDLLKKHRRLVALSRKSRFFSEGLRKRQEDLQIPPHKVLTTTATHAIRWSNQFKQLDGNVTMQPLLDQTLSSLIAHQSSGKTPDDPVLVCSSDDGELSDDGGAPNKAAVKRSFKATELSLTSPNWISTTHLAGFLEHVHMIKSVIENNQTTSGMHLFFLKDLLLASASDQPLLVKGLPESAALKHRIRPARRLDAGQVDESVKLARVELSVQLTKRFFDVQPSKTRLVSTLLCKQGNWKDVLPAAWHATAKAAYFTMLRNALRILPNASQSGVRTSPRKSPKASVGQLFRAQSADSPAPRASGDESDAVVHEADAWAGLGQDRLSPFFRANGLLDEFKFFSSAAIKKEFPLHVIVFRQTSCHLGHEGNVESSFSTVKALDDPNMNVSFLTDLCKAAGKKKLSKPTAKRIWTEYQRRFRDTDNTVQNLLAAGSEVEASEEEEEEG